MAIMKKRSNVISLRSELINMSAEIQHDPCSNSIDGNMALVAP
jgi:hypothetical protein